MKTFAVGYFLMIFIAVIYTRLTVRYHVLYPLVKTRAGTANNYALGEERSADIIGVSEVMAPILQ